MAEFDRERIKEVVEKYGADLIAEIRRLLKKEDSVASGELLRSFRWDAVSAARQLQYVLKSEEYFQYVNEGRGPGEQPPLKEIIKWTRLKGIPERAAFPIAKHIGKTGIEGEHILKRALKKVNRDLKGELQDVYEEEIIDFINEAAQQAKS